jgi:adenylate cyclase class 2
MYEVEVKVRADHDSVRERLAALDADHLGRVTQVDTYYDAPDRDFAKTDEALRVRRETDGSDGETAVFVTYKGPRVDGESKTREEAETRVADEAAMRSILAGLGYEPAATVEKDRDRYALDGCTVTLDYVEGLGEFVEVEAGDGVAGADIEDARHAAVAVLEQLELDADDQIQTSYLGLLLAE